MRPLLVVGAIASLNLAACHDAVAPLAERPGDRLRPERLTPSPENAYQCSIVRYEHDGMVGGFVRERRTLPVVPSNERGLGVFRQLRWDETSQDAAFEAWCVVPRTQLGDMTAIAFLDDLYAATRPTPAGQATWNGERVDCYYYAYDDHVECGGEYCVRWGASLRSDGEPVEQASSESYKYQCGNGCDIYDFSYYSCPDGDSGPVDEDGGLPPGDGDGSGNEENPGEIAEENLPQAEPDCSVPIDSMPTAIKTWCFGRFPAGIELEKLQTAIGRLNGMGGPCVTIAQKFEQMLADSAVKIFTPQRGWPGGASTLGGDWLTIADGWLTTWEEEWTPAGRNLPSTITHEVDHVLRHVDPTSTTTDRRGHLIENGYLNEYHTMNSKTCR